VSQFSSLPIHGYAIREKRRAVAAAYRDAIKKLTSIIEKAATMLPL